MNSRLLTALALIAVGLVLATVSGLAELIGLGDPADTFGWKQIVGLAVGVALLVAGIVIAAFPFGCLGRGASNMPRLTSPLLALGCLVALTAVVFVRHLFEGWTFPWDFLGTYSATPPFVAATFGRMHPLAFSPFVASGFPVEVNPQAGIYFPLWWLLGLLHVPLTLSAVTAVQVAHVLFGACGMLALSRVRGLRWPWATFAGVAYLLFGGFYGEAEHADIFRGFAYLPWILWALTPPRSSLPWRRLLALPLLTWLVVSGAYPGQTVSFAIIGAVYVAVELRLSPPESRRHTLRALLLAAVACGAICAAALLPYLLAQQDLFRAVPPTAANRAAGSLAPRDLLGAYLNTFAWHWDGSVTSWALAVPILIGLAAVSLAVLRAQLALVASGAVALALAMTPKIGFIGEAMVAAGPLFPSRFPAPDYKAAVAIALIVLSAGAWSEVGAGRVTLRRRAATVLMGAAVIAGIFLAPDTFGPPTRWPAVAVAVAGVSVGLCCLRSREALLIAGLLVLVTVDGLREAHDYRFLNKVSSWEATPDQVTRYRPRDQAIRKLPTSLHRPRATRPARIPPYASLAKRPTGTPPDAAGWVADGYHLVDYASTIERVRWTAVHDPVWSRMLQAPWRAYVFPCPAGGCATSPPRLPDRSTWKPGSGVRTLSYGTDSVVYSVQLDRPAVMVENELAIRGWRADTSRAQIVPASIPLRTWRLAPGSYRFTARFTLPGRGLQGIAAAVAVLAWVGCLLALRRRRGAQPESFGLETKPAEPAAATSRKVSYSRM